jgi:hypothetical protein
MNGAHAAGAHSLYTTRRSSPAARSRCRLGDAAAVGGHVGDAALQGLCRRSQPPKELHRDGHELVPPAEATARVVRTPVDVPILHRGARRVAAAAAAKDGAAGCTIDMSPTKKPEDVGAVKSPRDSTPRCASHSRRALAQVRLASRVQTCTGHGAAPGYDEVVMAMCQQVAQVSANHGVV